MGFNRVLVTIGVFAFASYLEVAIRAGSLSLGAIRLAMHASSIFFLWGYWWHGEVIESMCLEMFAAVDIDVCWMVK